MNGKMKALVFYGPKDLKVKEVEIPQISDNDILVKVAFCGVCGTDNRIYQGTKKIKAPRIIGHEFSGVVAEIGKDVNEYNLGERVCVYPMIHCGECYACKNGNTNICVNRKTIGYEIDGGFAEYVKIPYEAIRCGNVVRIPDSVPDDVASIAEPVSAAYHGIQRLNLVEGQTLVIVGAGPIGLFHVQLAKTRKPKQIIVIEPVEEKRKMAMSLGANIGIDPFVSDAVEIIFRATDGEGVDAVIIDVGQPAAVEASLEYVKKSGRIVLFAGLKEGDKITINPNLIHYREIEFTGSSSSSAKIMKEVLDLCAQKKINMKEMISGVFTLSDWEKAFIMKNEYVGIKSIIDVTSL